jgi:hypothetical protein
MFLSQELTKLLNIKRGEWNELLEQSICDKKGEGES